jgi:hypothetical protein
MPDSSTNTISLPSRQAFFKGRPGAALPAAHCIFIALDGPFLGLFRTEAQSAQNWPDVRLAKAHAVHAFDDRTHALESPQFGAKAVLGRTLQNRLSH